MRKKWSKQEDEIIIAEYPITESADLAVKLNCSIQSLYDRAYLLGVHKDPVYFETHKAGRLKGETGMTTRFQKGHIPYNLGIKGICHSPATTFKKGNIPQTYRPIGSTRMNADGYLEIKIADPNVWNRMHRLVWECENGPIPEGKLVKFRDNNHWNCDILNLYLADRKENMAQNTFIRYPPDLRATMKALKKLTKTIEEHGTQQN